MLKDVKIMMDESSRQSLDMLRSNLDYLLDPLKQISSFAQEFSDIKDSLNNISDDMHQKINDLTDSLDLSQIHSTLKLVVQKQEKIGQELTKLSKKNDDFVSAFSQINWDNSAQDSK